MGAKTKAILHIGTHKTGSSHLQHWLIDNRKALADCGFNAVSKITIGHNLARSAKDRSSQTALPVKQWVRQHGLRQALREFQRGSGHTAVISSEYLWDADPAALRTALEELGFEVVSVICFLRRQDRLAASEYNQSVKVLGRSAPFQVSSYLDRMAWDKLYEGWRSAFPDAAMRFLGYDHLAQSGQLLPAFRAAIGAPDHLSGEIIPEDYRNNFSLNAPVMEIARLANQRGDQTLMKGLFRNNHLLPKEPRFGPPQEAVDQLEAAFLAGNQRLFERLNTTDLAPLAEPGWRTEGISRHGEICEETFVDLLAIMQDQMGAAGAAPGREADYPLREDLNRIAAAATARGHDIRRLLAETQAAAAAMPADDDPASFPAQAAMDALAHASKIFLACNSLIRPDTRILRKPPKPVKTELSPLRDDLLTPLRRLGLRKLLHGPFDPEHYVSTYRDIRKAGVDPYRHWRKSGRGEGRSPIGERPGPEGRLSQRFHARLRLPFFSRRKYAAERPELAFDGRDPLILHAAEKARRRRRAKYSVFSKANPAYRLSRPFSTLDPAKETVLVGIHEGTLTGAPIIGHNIVLGLLNRYNVVVLGYKPGPVLDACARDGALVVTNLGPLREWSNGHDLTEMILRHVRLKCAILNAYGACYGIGALFQHGVPTTTLIHEFAAVLMPWRALGLIMALSDTTIFPARIVRQAALERFPMLVERRCPIVPQGICEPPVKPDMSGYESDLRIQTKLGVAKEEDAILIAGIGTVDYRKGVDLFIDCAARIVAAAPEANICFAWIGRGFEPGKMGGYIAMLAQELEQKGLKDRLTFAGEVRNMAAVYQNVDMLLLTSRLDPFPNVALESFDAGKPALVFDRTTGIAEFLAGAGVAPDCVARYLDTTHMAEKAVALINDPKRRAKVGARLKAFSDERLDIRDYRRLIEELAMEAVELRRAKTAPKPKRKAAT